MGSQLLVQLLPEFLKEKHKGIPQQGTDEPRAARLSREIGFEPWDTFVKALSEKTEAARIERKFRALHPWPGVWTTYAGKRLKILALHVSDHLLIPDSVQLEGKNPVSWEQFSSAYLPHAS
jgi:methionyl-tRNA formyltransferase